MKSAWHVGVSFSVLAAAVACGGEALDAGSSGSGGAGASIVFSGSGGVSGSGGGAVSGSSGKGDVIPPCEDGEGGLLFSCIPPVWPDDEVCDSGAELDIKGTWVGQVLGDSLGPFSSNEVTLTIEGLNQDGAPCGTIVFGEGEPLPLATDAAAIYPPESTGLTPPPWEDDEDGKSWGVLPGAPQSVINASVSEKRLTFEYGRYEPWRDWCKLQTPTQHFDGSYGHIPESTKLVDGKCFIGDEEISCDVVYMRGSVRCYCDATSCDAATTDLLTTVDLYVHDDEMDGMLDDRTIFLERAP